MRSYKFSLENILEYRTNIEKDTIEKFSIAQKRLEDEKTILENLSKEHNNMKENRKHFNNIHELGYQQLYLDKQKERVDQQKKTVNQSEDHLERKQKELIEAKKEKEIMEKLRERDFNTYRKKIERIQQKELDEAAVLGYQASPSS